MFKAERLHSCCFGRNPPWSGDYWEEEEVSLKKKKKENPCRALALICWMGEGEEKGADDEKQSSRWVTLRESGWRRCLLNNQVLIKLLSSCWEVDDFNWGRVQILCWRILVTRKRAAWTETVFFFNISQVVFCRMWQQRSKGHSAVALGPVVITFLRKPQRRHQGLGHGRT